MIFNTSTRIAPIVDVSTYEGPFSYDSLWQSDEDSEREEGRFVCNDYDFSKMGDRIVEEANKVFEANKPLSQYGVVSIKATRFGSPREYNFMSDWLDLDVEVDDSFWQLAKEAILKPENRAKIVEYAGNHWVSRDGFTSFMLNRVSGLSRDCWKGKHYGTHMATDKEVEDALLADLEDAFNALASETSEDEFREFGAILALLWLVEYPSDFDISGDSFYGSWVTDEMVESIQQHSSLSEFCTVLEPEEVKLKLDGKLIDFDGFLADLDGSYRKYVESGVGDASVAKAKAWLSTVREEVEEKWKPRQRGSVEWHAPNWEKISEMLDELREGWDARLEAGWPGAWK